MSKASEWAEKAQEAPTIVLATEGQEYRVRAAVLIAFGPDARFDASFALGLNDTEGNRMAIRTENALLLARWIINTFGDFP